MGEENSGANETWDSPGHHNGMGRDEMNLAEFPLATLADRVPKGCKTLVFEDVIWDGGQGIAVVACQTIRCSKEIRQPATRSRVSPLHARTARANDSGAQTVLCPQQEHALEFSLRYHAGDRTLFCGRQWRKRTAAAFRSGSTPGKPGYQPG